MMMLMGILCFFFGKTSQRVPFSKNDDDDDERAGGSINPLQIKQIPRFDVCFCAKSSLRQRVNILNSKIQPCHE
jgi:hypothetical protein